MNILVTLNSNYLEVLVVMLKSLALSNKHKYFDDDEMWNTAESRLRDVLNEAFFYRKIKRMEVKG